MRNPFFPMSANHFTGPLRGPDADHPHNAHKANLKIVKMIRCFSQNKSHGSKDNTQHAKAQAADHTTPDQHGFCSGKGK